jgi:NADH-quinone oxidoreductase subunit N
MFFANPSADAPAVVVPSALTTTAIALAVATTVVLGVFPQPILDIATDSALFLR